MSKLPVVSAKVLARALEKAGFVYVGQKGSHAHFRHRSDTMRYTSIPMHRGDVPRGTVKAILRQARITKKELLVLL